jgi:hypothetical protein
MLAQPAWWGANTRPRLRPGIPSRTLIEVNDRFERVQNRESSLERVHLENGIALQASGNAQVAALTEYWHPTGDDRRVWVSYQQARIPRRWVSNEYRIGFRCRCGADHQVRFDKLFPAYKEACARPVRRTESSSYPLLDPAGVSPHQQEPTGGVIPVAWASPCWATARASNTPHRLTPWRWSGIPPGRRPG